MSLVQAIVLGIVQGLTEFLPVSSSGHLILVPYFFDWDPQALTFDVALHVGTLVAVLAYFRRDWWRMSFAFFRDIRRARSFGALSPDARMLVLLAIGSVPAAVAGAALNSVEDSLREPAVVAPMLVVVGLVMLRAEAIGRQERGLESLTRADALVTGAAQAMALVPGVSRSGITISAGLFRGFDRAAATRFSFLLATPVVFGAALFAFAGVLFGSSDESFEVGPFVAGAATAGIVGFIVIHYLLRYLRFNTLRIFVWYRIALAVVVVVVALVR